MNAKETVIQMIKSHQAESVTPEIYNDLITAVENAIFEIPKISSAAESDEKTCMQKVKAITDSDGHWYIIPNELYHTFLEDKQNEDFIDNGGFDAKYGQYMTGGDLNIIQLYKKPESDGK